MAHADISADVRSQVGTDVSDDFFVLVLTCERYVNSTASIASELFRQCDDVLGQPNFVRNHSIGTTCLIC
jgi:hypothetical protein